MIASLGLDLYDYLNSPNPLLLHQQPSSFHPTAGLRIAVPMTPSVITTTTRLDAASRRGKGNNGEQNLRPDLNIRPDEEGTSISRHVINWYPGHIAKAEKELQDFLKLVDVVIEARDARIPAATTHPMVRQCKPNAYI